MLQWQAFIYPDGIYPEMESIKEFIQQFNGIVSGPILLPLLAGAGLFLTIGLRLTTLRRIPYAFRMLWDGRKKPTRPATFPRSMPS